MRWGKGQSLFSRIWRQYVLRAPEQTVCHRREPRPCGAADYAIAGKIVLLLEPHYGSPCTGAENAVYADTRDTRRAQRVLKRADIDPAIPLPEHGISRGAGGAALPRVEMHPASRSNVRWHLSLD